MTAPCRITMHNNEQSCLSICKSAFLIVSGQWIYCITTCYRQNFSAEKIVDEFIYSTSYMSINSVWAFSLWTRLYMKVTKQYNFPLILFIMLRLYQAIICCHPKEYYANLQDWCSCFFFWIFAQFLEFSQIWLFCDDSVRMEHIRLFPRNRICTRSNFSHWEHSINMCTSEYVEQEMTEVRIIIKKFSPRR